MTAAVQLALRPADGLSPDDLPPRLAAKVQVQDGGCWEWTASRKPDGYGQVNFKGKKYSAHRLTYWLLMGGPLTEVLHHTCRNRRCVNPAHLMGTTHRDHPDSAPAVRRAKEACPAGHMYSPANTIVEKGGGRRCRTCVREYRREYDREYTRTPEYRAKRAARMRKRRAAEKAARAAAT